jgi:1-acyl-sn-glycerol-3-phosphate acyltransferase
METARKACDKFRLLPVTIMNFLEGTRFTEAKRGKEHSPYAHLLKPKAGGMAVVLNAMGNRIQSILDVTIVYPEGATGLWRFLCASSTEIRVRVKQISVTPELAGDPLKDREARRRFKDWLDNLWREKDKLIETLSRSPARKSEGAENG